jgi:TonB family protein
MLISPESTIRNIGCATLLLLSASAGAQSEKLNHLGEQIAKQCKTLAPRNVSVADLTAWDGKAADLGHYFAWFLTAAIHYHGGGKVHVADHDRFDAVLKQINISPSQLSEASGLKALAGKANADIVLVGTIEKQSEDYVLQETAFRSSDGTAVFSQSVEIPRTAFLDSLAEPFPPKMDERVIDMKAKDIKLTPPRCVQCPIPRYTSSAREAKVQGTVLLKAIVTREGRATNLHPIRFLGFGLDEVAYETIKQWKFEPGKMPDGTPVATIVPIEVRFRTY